MTKEEAYEIAVGLAKAGRDLDILMGHFSEWAADASVEQAAANLALWGLQHATKEEVLTFLEAAAVRLHEAKGTTASEEYRLVRIGQRAGEQVPHRTLFFKSSSRDVVEQHLLGVAPFDGDNSTESWWIERVQLSEKVLESEEVTRESVLASRSDPSASSPQ